MKELLKLGADPSLEDVDGRTAEQLALIDEDSLKKKIYAALLKR